MKHYNNIFSSFSDKYFKIKLINRIYQVTFSLTILYSFDLYFYFSNKKEKKIKSINTKTNFIPFVIRERHRENEMDLRDSTWTT